MVDRSDAESSLIQRELRSFFRAWVFFTRLPAPTGLPLDQVDHTQAIKYFPLIGVFIGACSAAVFHIFHILFPLPFALLMCLLASVLLTGALHEDGLADSCDGFGGGWDKAQVLAIMKDSHLGTYGALGLLFVLLSKFIALYELAAQPWFAWVLIAGHSLSRLAALTVMHSMPYVRDPAMSKCAPLVQDVSVPVRMLAMALGLAVPIVLLLIGPALGVVTAITAVFIIRWMLGRYFQRRVGGYTGDCLGATQQVTELVFYAVLLVPL